MISFFDKCLIQICIGVHRCCLSYTISITDLSRIILSLWRNGSASPCKRVVILKSSAYLSLPMTTKILRDSVNWLSNLLRHEVLFKRVWISLLIPVLCYTSLKNISIKSLRWSFGRLFLESDFSKRDFNKSELSVGVSVIYWNYFWEKITI